MTQKNTYRLLLIGLLSTWLFSSCREFVFGEIKEFAEREEYLTRKRAPRSGAELYYEPKYGGKPLPTTQQTLPNPDSKGALKDWYTCLVMFKEGHSHEGGKMHGNYVYTRAPWKREQFAEIHNTPDGPQISIDRKSIQTAIEAGREIEAPNYFRLTAGTKRLWGLCLYFYDKQGRLLNDSILKHSDEYQIFFAISDVDDHNRPYDILDVRWTKEDKRKYKDELNEDGDSIEIVERIKGRPAHYFKDKPTLEARRKASPLVFQYTYRDTWTQDDMADGRRRFNSIRLLPPLTSAQRFEARTDDVDCVGLKGHFQFDFLPGQGLDPHKEWPIDLLWAKQRYYSPKHDRWTYLLPQFYLAVQVMKCPKGKKDLDPLSPEDYEDDRSQLRKTRCAPNYAPNPASEWKEVLRFNLPIRIFTSSYDTNPTRDDPNEPYYFHIGREIGLTPIEAYEAERSKLQTSEDDGETAILGFGSWFL